MKKLISIVLLLSLVLSLTACGHEHTWQEATCTQPKTCAECGETEGEALGHDPTEATVWEPSVCSRCGEVLGEALEPDFVIHEIDVIDINDVPTEFFNGEAISRVPINESRWRLVFPDSPTTYYTGPSDGSNYAVDVNVRLVDYSIIESDEEHEGLEGYEWRIATFDHCFFSGLHGWQLAVSDEDYYDIEGHDDSAVGPFYTVTWQGETYDQCIRIITYGEWGKVTIPEEGSWGYQCYNHPVTFAFRVPVGYDGTVVCLRDSFEDFEKGQYIYDVMKSTDLFIRLT